MGVQFSTSDMKAAVQSARAVIRRARDRASATQASLHLTPSGRASALNDRYRALSREMSAIRKEIDLPDNAPIKDFLEQRKNELNEQMTVVGQKLINRARLVTVRPSDEAILQQLVDNEKVHPVSGTEEMRKTRVGRVDQDKAAYALVVDTKEGPLVLAGIFVKYAVLPVNGDMQPAYKDIRGDVGVLKAEKPQKKMKVRPEKRVDIYAPELTGVDSVTLYTISSAVKGGGKALVNDLTQSFQGQTLVSTLSPVREFYAFKGQEILDTTAVRDAERETAKECANSGDMKQYKRRLNNIGKQFLAKQSEASIKAMTIDYLTRVKDPVMNFHLSNGAYIGDIKVNSDGTDPVTVNYVYPSDPEIRARNSQAFADGRIAVAGNLRSIVPADRNILNVGGAGHNIDRSIYSWPREPQLVPQAA
ncbi:MAG: malonyl-CoA decarboxylase family protein [Pseudomonadota bacterium]